MSAVGVFPLRMLTILSSERLISGKFPQYIPCLLGRICPGGIEVRECVYWHSIQIDVSCGEELFTIFCWRRHLA
jgi:hypothetical protein